MGEPAESGSGAWRAVSRVLDLVLATAQNRVELFGVEVQEEKCKLVETILVAATFAGLAAASLALITFTVVVLFWENGRLAALLCLSVVYFSGTIAAWRGLRKRLKDRSAFAGTLGELKKDRACLKIDP